MGNSKSQQFSSLLSPFRVEEWKVVQQRETHQLWQRRSDSRRFMAYPINETLFDSEQKLQLYNFRKLNHGSLVAVDCILYNEGEYLCSFPKSRHVMVENIPFTLAAFRRALNLAQAMTILSAAFAGYNMLNYVYGPLFTDEAMIGFTEEGRPKVWVNPNFSTNQPSSFAINGGEEQTVTNIEERTYCCIQRIIDVVQQCLVGGYPSEFRQEAIQVPTFSEGEELVQGYCRHWGIVMLESISISKFNKVQPLVFRAETHLHSDRVSLNTFPVSINNFVYQADQKHELSTLNSQRPLKSGPFLQGGGSSKVLTTYRPVLRWSVNNGNGRINFVFNNAANSVLLRERVVYSNRNIHIPVENRVNLMEKRQQSGNGSCTEKQPRPTPNNLPNYINNIQSREQIQLHVTAHYQDQEQALESMKEVAQHDQIEDKQLPLHQDSSVPPAQIDRVPPAQIDRVPTTESVEEGAAVLRSLQSEFPFMQPFDELKKWQQSLIKLSAKKEPKRQQQLPLRQSSDERQYLSEERDTVVVEQPQVRLFANQSDLQTYVRSKYRDYFVNESQNQIQREQVIQNTQQEHYEKEGRGRREPEVSQSSYFNQYYEIYEAQESVEELPHPFLKQSKKGLRPLEEGEQLKYTFGKIELDPTSAVQQYSRAIQKQQGKSMRHRTSIQPSSLQQKYRKYVKNREQKSRSISSSDISAILKGEETERSSKRDYLAREYLPDSIKESGGGSGKTLRQGKGLTYDKLREMLWA